MTKYILLLPILLTGCAISPHQPADKQCAQVASYARSVSVMKDAGVTLMDINSFTAQPVALTFPLQLLKLEVYNSDLKTPADTYAHFYGMCVTNGYDAMLLQLKQAGQAHEDNFLKMSFTLTYPVVEKNRSTK